MCDNSRKSNTKKKKFKNDDGFEEWGGYKAAKVSKLADQFVEDSKTKLSTIFDGIAIHVNGQTHPSAEALRKLMSLHGGRFHMYPASSTTHLIASNLPNVKIKNLGTKPIVKPSWIVDSIDVGKLLDFKRYLLYTNQSVTQPKLGFPMIQKDNSSYSSTFETKSDAPLLNSSKALTAVKTASDENFLEDFYNNSRLHLIATLGAEFKQMVGQMRDKSKGVFPGLDKLKDIYGKRSDTPNHKVIMHIDMDCFFVSVGLRNHPEYRGKPVAITHAKNGVTSSDRSANRDQEFRLYHERLGDGFHSRVELLDGSASMSEIASCSYEARKFGIKNGMFLGVAIKLCPDLKTLPYDFDGYKEVSKILYETIASYTLDIEAVSCDEMYVDCTKILQETGLSVMDFATIIRTEITRITGCPCSAGFGSNRLQSRLATRKAKPNGQYYINPDDVEAYMAEIPLSDLPGVGSATLAKLKSLGLQTCGDVQNFNLRKIQADLGQKAGETVFEQCKGIDKKPLNFYHERKSVSAEVNYGIRFKNLEECYNFLRSLSVEVFNRLTEIGLRSRCLTLKLMVRAANAPIETAKFMGHGVCDHLTKTTNDNAILTDSNTIFNKAKILYEKLNAPYNDLRGIGLQLTKLEKVSNKNTVLSKFLNQKTIPKKKFVKEIENPLEKCSEIRVDKNIDTEVLNELPKDIRNEVMQQQSFKMTKNIQKKKTKKAVKRTKNPFYKLSWAQIKPIVLEWFQNEITPIEYDAKMIAKHFSNLAKKRNIEMLFPIFNFLHRTISKLNCDWHKIYFVIVELTQIGVVNAYGKNLALKSDFKCCKM